VRFCEELPDVEYIVRGIRNVDDCKTELEMLNLNLRIARITLTTIFLSPPSDIGMVSSSMVKGLCGPEGWEEVVHPYVPAVSFQALKKWKSGNIA
jgi:pantetheine-phosphate adenylyltransferase